MSRSGYRRGNFTVETRRHREESVDPVIARDRVIEKTVSSSHPFSSDYSLSLCHPEREQVEQRETRSNRRTQAKSVSENAASGSSHETKQFSFSITRSRAISRFLSVSQCLRGEILFGSYENFSRHATGNLRRISLRPFFTTHGRIPFRGKLSRLHA